MKETNPDASHSLRATNRGFNTDLGTSHRRLRFSCPAENPSLSKSHLAGRSRATSTGYVSRWDVERPIAESGPSAAAESGCLPMDLDSDTDRNEHPHLDFRNQNRQEGGRRMDSMSLGPTADPCGRSPAIPPKGSVTVLTTQTTPTCSEQNLKSQPKPTETRHMDGARHLGYIPRGIKSAKRARGDLRRPRRRRHAAMALTVCMGLSEPQARFT